MAVPAAASGGPVLRRLRGPLAEFIVEEAKKTLDSYRAQPRLVIEHANLEHDTAHGGYAHRQLFELVQNSADALLDFAEGLCQSKSA